MRHNRPRVGLPSFGLDVMPTAVQDDQCFLYEIICRVPLAADSGSA
jgi:hypothetical protein